MPYLRGSDADKMDLIKADDRELWDKYGSWREFITTMDSLASRKRGRHGIEDINAIRLSDDMQGQINSTRYTDTQVTRMVDTFLNRLERGPISVHAGLLSDSADDAAKKSSLENLCLGWVNQLNHDTSESTLSHIRRLGASAARRGKIIQRISFYEVDGMSKLRWDLYDPINCAHDFTGPPKRFVAHTTHRISYLQWLLSTMGVEIPAKILRDKKPSDTAVLKEYWLEDIYDTETVIYRAFLIDDEPVGPPVLMPNKRFPIQWITSNSLGPIAPDMDMIAQHAQPFYHSMLHPIINLERLLSMEMFAASLAINPPIVTSSPDGVDTTDEASIGPNTRISKSHDVTIETLQYVTRALDTFSTPDFIRSSIQQGWSDALWGLTSGANESGYLYTQRIDAAKTAILPATLLVAKAYEHGFAEALYQSKESNTKVRLSFVNQSGQSQGQFHYREFNPSKDIPDSFALKVEPPPMLPEDDLAAAQINLTLQQGGVSKERSLQSALRISDPRAEMDRKSMEDIEQMEEFRNIRMLRMMRHEYEQMFVNAERERDRRRAGILRREAAIAKSTYDVIAQKLLGALQGPPAGQAPPGIRPETQPPEQRGIQNPDVAAAAANGVSSYLGGRPREGGMI